MKRFLVVVAMLAITMLGALLAPPALAADSEFCWKDTYGRGVGTVPTSCAAGREMIGALCYSPCGPNGKRVGFDCHSVCPPGMRDDGLFCRAAEYGRGAGYVLWDEGKCNKENAQGCEKNGAMWYPKCQPGYENVGCCICRPKVPDCTRLGLGARTDLSCAKLVKVGDPVAGACAAGQQADAGLCYKNCGAGYSGVGPVCWGQCPASHPWECGAGCAKSEQACADAIADQVMSVLEMAANVAMGVGSAGTFSVAKTVAKVTEKSVADIIRKQAVKMGKNIAESVLKTYAQASYRAITTGEFDPSSLAGIDPTGIASIVTAYAKPLCTPPAAGAPPIPTRPASRPTLSSLPNIGLVLDTGFEPLEPTANTNASDVAVSAKGAEWYIGKGGADGAIYRWTASGPQQVAGAAKRIAVAPDGTPWVVNSSKVIYRWSGTDWTQMPGAAIDIGIGSNGAVWVLGTDRVPYRWDGSKWVQLSGGGVSIAVDPQGNPWVVNANNEIWRYVSGTWKRLPGAATDIAIANNGTAYVVGGGGQLFSMGPGATDWQAVPGAVGVRVGAGRWVQYAK